MSKQKAQRPTPAPAKAAPRKTVAAPAAPPPDWQALADRYALPALGALVLIALILRILNLDALSLWVDEFVHVFRARNFNAGTGPLLTDDNNGILLTAVMIPFFKIFGDTAFWARIPSVLFGAGSVYLMYRLGERLFNRYVGLLGAFAGTFSLYLIFWSRMGRNYSIFAFFYLLLGLLFLKAFENKEEPESSDFWRRNGISLKHLLWMLPVLAASWLSHQLTFFFPFTVGTYAVIIAAGKIRRGEDDRFRNKYFWLGVASLPLLLMVLPGVNDLLRIPLSALLSAQQVDWVLPQASRLSELWAKQPWEAFRVYHGVLRYDPTLLYFAAVAGLVVAFSMRSRSAAWLFGSVVTPFLLMSFLFRDPTMPRYFIFVFPWFLLSAGVFFYWLFRYLSQKVFPGTSHNFQYALLLLPFLIMLGSVRWKEMKRLVLAEQVEGHVMNENIADCNFTNWKQPSDFVKQHMQAGDVLMSTVTNAAAYYLKEDNVLWFRQMHYDTKLKRYVQNAPEPGKYSAATFEDLQRTVASAPRGWLLADYYLDNVFVDEQSRMFVYQNLQYYPEASPDGSVKVFGWDRNKPRPQNQNLVIQLGKAADKIVSTPFAIDIPQNVYDAPTIQMDIRYQGVNSNREALVIFNDDNAVYLPPNQGKGIENQKVTLQKQWLRPGPNKVQLMYEEAVKSDPDKGFTVYFIEVRG
jgi:4-amino-4-deoxy-L-arabinose transferase-like glycosyltransferase